MIHRCFFGKWRVPYPNRHPFEIITKVAKENVRPEIDPLMPPPFVDILTKCWHPDPQTRPNCEEILQLLQVAHKDYKLHKDIWNSFYTKPSRETMNRQQSSVF